MSIIDNEIEIKAQSYLASLPAAWDRRFPQREYLRPIQRSKAESVYSKICGKVIWAFAGLGYRIIWVGNRLEAKVIPYGADPETFRQVSLDDFLCWYGLTVVEDQDE